MQPILSLVRLVPLLALCGCISHESTVVKDVERTRVEFENETAGRIFYETLSKQAPKYSKSESTTEVSLPIVYEHKRHVVTGANTAFNEAVSICDVNKDGKITEVEAKIYAEQAK
jgi:hypothetical protein